MRSLWHRNGRTAVLRAAIAVGVAALAGTVAQAQCMSGGGGGGGTSPPGGFTPGGGGTSPPAGFGGGTPGIASQMQAMQLASQMQQMRRQAIMTAMWRRQMMRQMARQRRQQSQNQFSRANPTGNTTAFASVSTDSLTPHERRRARIKERQAKLKAYREKQARLREEYRQRQNSN